MVKEVLVNIKEKNANFLISPLSVYITISLLQAVFLQGNSYHLDYLKNSYQNLLTKTFATDVDFYIGNKFFIQEGLKISKGALDIIKNVFHINSEYVNFGNNVKTVEVINKWASDFTNGKINDIIDYNDVDVFTKLMLVNASYFKSDWRTAFQKILTLKEYFHVNPNKQLPTDMMYTTGNFEYFKDEQNGY